MRLTKQQFRTYLQEHPDKVFKPRNACECPIATAVSDLNPRATHVEVDRWSINWHIGKGRRYHCVETTAWQKAFVADVDHQGGTITGRGALAVLEGA